MKGGKTKYYIWGILAIFLIIILLFVVFSNLRNKDKEKDFSGGEQETEDLLDNGGDYGDEDYNESEDEDNSSIFYGWKRLSSPVSSIGVLKIVNAIHYNFTSGSLRIIHREGALEGFDEKDSTHYPMFTPSGKASKIISRVEEEELEIDSRPLTSTSTFYLELSIISIDDQPITLNSYNRLRFSFPREDMDYVFNGKEIFIQQYNPENSSETFQEYNVRELISQNDFINLTNLNGTYESDAPYAYFRITID